MAEHQWSGAPVQRQPEQQIDFACKKDGVSKPAESNVAKISQGLPAKQVWPSQIQVIELSDDDDEENEKPSTVKPVKPHPAEQLKPVKPVPAEQLQSEMWHYRDPQGVVQGPFSIISLKHWSDACYFGPDFKVWKSGQSQFEAVLLVDILSQIFPRGSKCI